MKSSINKSLEEIYKDLDKSTDEFLDSFKKYLDKWYGPKCDDFYKGCICCEVWDLYETCAQLFQYGESDQEV